MVLEKIELINFRNYEKISIKFDSKINILVGDNAQGKTNILESIYVLALTKSHRIINDCNLIKKENNFCKIRGIIIKDDISKKLEIKISPKEKKVKLNDKKIKNYSNYISNLNIIMFCPDDLEVIKGSPGIRRNYINIELAQISKKYLKVLNEYNKLLKIRNECLKLISLNKIKDKIYYEVITNNLIERAIKIYVMRKEFIEKINYNIGKIYKDITNKETLYIKYDSFINFNKENEVTMKKDLLNTFTNLFEKEIEQGITLIGPHRDDFSFWLNDSNLKYFGSQGQQRVAILAFKIAEIEIFKETTTYYPLLLLDDVFSELDKKKVNNILKYIDKNFQTIITTTNIKNIKKQLVSNAKVFEIVDGNIKIKQEVI